MKTTKQDISSSDSFNYKVNKVNNLNDEEILKEVDKLIAGYVPSKAIKMKQIIKEGYQKAISLTRDAEQKKFGNLKMANIVLRNQTDNLIKLNKKIKEQKDAEFLEFVEKWSEHFYHNHDGLESEASEMFEEAKEKITSLQNKTDGGK